MCDLDGAKKSLESLLDEVRELKEKVDRYEDALMEISNLDYLRAAINCAAFNAVKIAEQALAGKEGG